MFRKHPSRRFVSVLPSSVSLAIDLRRAAWPEQVDPFCHECCHRCAAGPATRERAGFALKRLMGWRSESQGRGKTTCCGLTRLCRASTINLHFLKKSLPRNYPRDSIIQFEEPSRRAGKHRLQHSAPSLPDSYSTTPKGFHTIAQGWSRKRPTLGSV